MANEQYVEVAPLPMDCFIAVRLQCLLRMEERRLSFLRRLTESGNSSIKEQDKLPLGKVQERNSSLPLKEELRFI